VSINIFIELFIIYKTEYSFVKYKIIYESLKNK